MCHCWFSLTFPFMRSLFFHIPVPSTVYHLMPLPVALTEPSALGHSLNQTWVHPHYEGLQPCEGARPVLKNCSIDFFHLQLCLVMGNHDIYIHPTPIRSPPPCSAQVFDTDCSSKQVTRSRVSLARRSHWVDPFPFLQRMVFFSPSPPLYPSIFLSHQ